MSRDVDWLTQADDADTLAVMLALSLHDVSKRFVHPKTGPFFAVDHVSFAVEPGEIHGLLGPNGAGKSTLISLISGAMEPSEGSLSVFGKDVHTQTEEAKQYLGIVPQEVVVEAAFTVYEVLYYFSGMYGVAIRERRPRIEDLLARLELTDKMHERARSLSGGMKRRLMIAKAMLHRPRLLILDEPTAGVDVALRQRIWELVRDVNAQGTTILFTTHYLEEAEQLCQRITLINHGKKIKDGKLKDIQHEFSQNMIHFELFDRSVPHMVRVRPVGVEFEYPLTDLASDVRALTDHYGSNIKSIRSEAASLEKIFLDLTSAKK